MTIPESKLRIALSLSASPLLLFIVWGAVDVGAPMLFTAALAVLAVALGLVVLLDLPTSIVIGSDGIQRVCLLRTQPVAWKEIIAIVQPRKSGLVLVTGNRKRIFLVSRKLTDAETDFLRDEARQRNVRAEF